MTQASRDELQTYATQQSGLVSELQSRNSQLSIDNESLRRRITDLQQVYIASQTIFSLVSLTPVMKMKIVLCSLFILFGVHCQWFLKNIDFLI